MCDGSRLTTFVSQQHFKGALKTTYPLQRQDESRRERGQRNRVKHNIKHTESKLISQQRRRRSDRSTHSELYLLKERDIYREVVRQLVFVDAGGATKVQKLTYMLLC